MAQRPSAIRLNGRVNRDRAMSALERRGERDGQVIDNFALGLTHGLMLLAAWRLLSRPDLEDDDAPPDAGQVLVRRAGSARPMRDLAFDRLPRGAAGARRSSGRSCSPRLYLRRHGLAAAPLLLSAEQRSRSR